MSGILSTDELKEFILNRYVMLKRKAEKDDIFKEINVYFSNGTPHNVEGTYAYSDESGYHYAFTERGKVRLFRTSTDLFDITYWIIKDQVFSMASSFATKHRNVNQDFRRTLFAKELELLEIIGNDFRKKYESEIDDILKKHPYNDNI